jgi:hypothetical protein
MISLGPFAHNGKGNYFDMVTKLPDEERAIARRHWTPSSRCWSEPACCSKYLLP